MSLIDLRVDLPSFSHSFLIRMSPAFTILDVKREIFKVCPGAPLAEGQRVIWRGRCLLDHERVQDIWKLKSADEPRLVHLAVHPSAWTSTPPESLVSHQPVPTLPHTPVPFYDTPHPPPNRTRHHLLPGPGVTNSYSQPSTFFILFKHENALLALTEGRTLPTPHSSDFDASRLLAMRTLVMQNWSWPTMLDDEFPPATEGGLHYERVIIDGKPYLTLRNASATPTPLQIHALKILTYTFAYLSLPAPTTAASQATPSYQIPIPPNLNLLLQQLGLPLPRTVPQPAAVAATDNNGINAGANPNINNANADAGQNGVMAAELRDIPFRPLIAPLAMLVIRTLLLLYFVAPARKPVIGILILGWMVYEGWRPIREGIRRGWGRQAAQQQQQQQQNGLARPAPVQGIQQGPGAEQDQGHGQQGQARQAGRPGGGGNNARENQGNVLVDTLANINLEREEAALAGTGEEPGVLHKAMTFLGLLIFTMHPAVWDRRRMALGRREGQVRGEGNARDAAGTGEGGTSADTDSGSDERAQVGAEMVARHARRAPWVKRYIERVRVGEWVDSD